jgi:hypothetical protein
MKIIFASVAFLLALQVSALGGIETDIPQANRVILTTGAWTPSPEETQKALIAIQSFLERPTSGDQWSKGEIKKILANTKRYRVQFVGFTQQNRRVIWCNFFPAPRTGEEDEFENWKHSKIVVYDGGYWFWQIDFDPGTGKCLHFMSNGYA